MEDAPTTPATPGLVALKLHAHETGNDRLDDDDEILLFVVEDDEEEMPFVAPLLLLLLELLLDVAVDEDMPLLFADREVLDEETLLLDEDTLTPLFTDNELLID